MRLGGIVERAAHPASGPLNGGPQMVEVSRDGRRVYLTNSLYAAWDAQFYPEGIDGWLVKLDAGEDGSLTLDPDLFVRSPASGRTRCACRAATRPRTPTASRTTDMDLWALLVIAALGAYHGLNPAMGWLFAVALGMQDRDRERRAAGAAADRPRPRAVARARGGGGARARAGGRPVGAAPRRPASR